MEEKLDLMCKTQSFVVTLVVLLLCTAAAFGGTRPVRPDIKEPANTRCSGREYILPTLAVKTVDSPATSREVASVVKPEGMPQLDETILADQIAVINNGKKVGTTYPAGTKLRVPVYRVRSTSLAQADMREWTYAIHAGFRWGVSPAFLLAVRNHENPSGGRDGFALGVMHAKWDGIWRQYEQGAWVIKELIADRQHWNPMSITANRAYRCGRSYAAGSTSWGPAVWALYKRARGMA